MTTFQAESTLSASGIFLARETAPDWINRPLPPEALPRIDFDWDPKSTLFAYTIGGTVFVTNSYRTSAGEPIQFTPDLSFPDSERYPVEFHWDFGDGGEGWGEEVSHTYIVGNPHIRATLRVRDNQGEFHFASHQMYLMGAEPILVTKAILLSSGGIFDGDSAYYV